MPASQTRAAMGLLVVAILVLLSGTAAAQITVYTKHSLNMDLASPDPIIRPGGPAVVRGTLTISVSAEPMPQGYVSFYVDGRAQYASNDPDPEYTWDTATVADGAHLLRIDVDQGPTTVATTGDVVVRVANQVPIAQTLELVAGQPETVKLHHKKILREAVWFNGREADLERNATIVQGRVCITMNDLVRHIGGQVDWGPPGNLVILSRGDRSIRIVPGSNKVYVNGEERLIVPAPFVKYDRTWIPVKPICDLLDLVVVWDVYTQRAYVWY